MALFLIRNQTDLLSLVYSYSRTDTNWHRAQVQDPRLSKMSVLMQAQGYPHGWQKRFALHLLKPGPTRLKVSV